MGVSAMPVGLVVLHVPAPAAMPGTNRRRRGAAKKFGTTKQQLKYNGNQYVNKCYTLELQAGSYQQQLQEEEQQAVAARNREQVWIAADDTAITVAAGAVFCLQQVVCTCQRPSLYGQPGFLSAAALVLCALGKAVGKVMSVS